MSDEVLVKKLRRITGWSFVVLPPPIARGAQHLGNSRMAEQSKDEVFMERGCNCSRDCGGHLQYYYKEAQEGCIFWAAKKRGPLVLKECIALCRDARARPVKTFHDRDGNCLRCEKEAGSVT